MMTTPVAHTQNNDLVAAPVPYAEYGTRFYAYLIDQSIIQLASLVLVYPFGIERYNQLTSFEETLVFFAEMLPVVSLVQFVAGVVYGAVMEASPWQATFGKRLRGLIVETGFGCRIGYFAAIMRNIAINLPIAVMALGGMAIGLLLCLPFLTPLISSKKQTFYDQAMNIVILKVK